MVSDVIEFSTNQKMVNFFWFFNDTSVMVRNLRLNFLHCVHKNFSKFFTIKFLPIGLPLKSDIALEPVTKLGTSEAKL